MMRQWLAQAISGPTTTIMDEATVVQFILDRRKATSREMAQQMANESWESRQPIEFMKMADGSRGSLSPLPEKP